MARSNEADNLFSAPFIACPLSTEALVLLLMSKVTQILAAIEQSDPIAAEQLLPLVYDELRRLAAQKLAQEKPGQTLDATALVHEAYLRLTQATDVQRWDGRGHFFAAAAEAMRRILVESARRKGRHKHGGRLTHLNFNLDTLVSPADDSAMLALDAALTRLAEAEPERARVVQLRFFAGLNNEEAAQVMGISSATAKRYWRYARAWLHRELGGSGL